MTIETADRSSNACLSLKASAPRLMIVDRRFGPYEADACAYLLGIRDSVMPCLFSYPVTSSYFLPYQTISLRPEVLAACRKPAVSLLVSHNGV